MPVCLSGGSRLGAAKCWTWCANEDFVGGCQRYDNAIVRIHKSISPFRPAGKWNSQIFLRPIILSSTSRGSAS